MYEFFVKFVTPSYILQLYQHFLFSSVQLDDGC